MADKAGSDGNSINKSGEKAPSSVLAGLALFFGMVLIIAVLVFIAKTLDNILSFYIPATEDGKPIPADPADISTYVTSSLAAVLAPLGTVIGIFTGLVAAIFAFNQKAASDAKATTAVNEKNEAVETAVQSRAAAFKLGEKADAALLADVKKEFPRAFGGR